MSPIGVTSNAATTLKRDTSAEFVGSTLRLYTGLAAHGTTPSSNQYLPGIILRDTGSANRVTLRAVAYTSGEQGLQFYTERNNVTNSLSLLLKADGTRSVSFSDASVWRTALGLGTAATQASSAFATAGHDHDSAYLKLSGGTLTNTLYGTYFVASEHIQVRADGEVTPFALRDTNIKNRAYIGVTTNNGFNLREYVTAGGVYENFTLPVPTASSNTTYNILTSKSAVTVAQGGTGASTAANARTNLGVNGKDWNSCSLGAFNATASNITLPSSGTWLIITWHNSTSSLNTAWIVRTSGNSVFGLAAAGTAGAGISGFTMCGTVGMKASGTTLTGVTVSGSVNVYGIKLG